jgi:hypothetical protein
MEATKDAEGNRVSPVKATKCAERNRVSPVKATQGAVMATAA